MKETKGAALQENEGDDRGHHKALTAPKRAQDIPTRTILSHARSLLGSYTADIRRTDPYGSHSSPDLAGLLALNQVVSD